MAETKGHAMQMVNASTPGSFLPSRNSRLAPPPVEMWVIWSATPAWLMALTESPPPMMEMAALLAATAWAMALVPTAKRETRRRRRGRSRRWCGRWRRLLQWP
jgi:hypothetical protein